MLETINLTKIYKPKKGVPVKALDSVSLRFPDKGMIFLLGKSGSGKSTLLNVLGGLDKYDDGDILIKGVSSRTFRQDQFDSYRNTYIGFIFQEYNVLDEFTVGANIALAIELQNRKADDAEINAILKQVDLSEYANRKPNELSGGQKQRVAIARALVKNPQIIMADEPTGALDSGTGTQVLDTLKKLSAEKLVIVVSHDREFAEKYADRIIELADGHVISDREYDETVAAANGLTFAAGTVTVPAAYHLTEEDRVAINAYIDRLSGGAKLELSDAGVQGARNSHPTDVNAIPADRSTDFQLIKSKLPLKSAFPIGASSLKYKKFRLVMTILLSCVAFGLFGLSDTFGAYDFVSSCTESLVDSGVSYASMVKSARIKSGNSYYYTGDYGSHLNENELKDIKAETGISMKGVYMPQNADLTFSGLYDPSVKFTETDFHIYAAGFNGFAEMSQNDLIRLGYTLVAGALPDGSRNEIALTAYECETFVRGGFYDGGSKTAAGEPIYRKISSAADMVGKKMVMNGVTYTVTGVIDTHFDLSRYHTLVEKKEHVTEQEKLIFMALFSELDYARSYSLNEVALVGAGFINRISSNQSAPKIMKPETYVWFSVSENGASTSPNRIGSLSSVKANKIHWLGEKKVILDEKDIILSADLIDYLINDGTDVKGGDAIMPNDAQNTEEFEKKLRALSLTMQNSEESSDYTVSEEKGYRVVGWLDSEADSTLSGVMLFSQSLYEKTADTTDGIYSFAVGAMPEKTEDIRKTVSYCYNETAPMRYEMMNAVTYEMNMANSVLKVLGRVFLYVGIGFALFAALMLANFIGTSIVYKKQEIGILRAIGARGNDVFRIFFSESFIIAMVNFILSSIGVGVATAFINYILRSRYQILVTFLNFGVRQVALLFVISVAIAALASFVPVKRIASKRPVDAMRGR